MFSAGPEVLERVPYGITYHAGLPLVGLLNLQLLAELLRVVPGAAGVRHHDRHHAARGDGPGERAHEAPRADRETDEDRGQDRVGAGGDHLGDARAGRDGDAAVAVGLHVLVLRDLLAAGGFLDAGPEGDAGL